MKHVMLEPRHGYLHIVGTDIDLPVVGPPPTSRVAPVTVGLALGALHRTCVASSYEQGAEQLLEVVRGWLERGPVVLLADLAKLAMDACAKHIDDDPNDLTGDLDALRGFAAHTDGRLKHALAETLVAIGALAAASSPGAPATRPVDMAELPKCECEPGHAQRLGRSPLQRCGGLFFCDACGGLL